MTAELHLASLLDGMKLWRVMVLQDRQCSWWQRAVLGGVARLGSGRGRSSRSCAETLRKGVVEVDRDAPEAQLSWQTSDEAVKANQQRYERSARIIG